MFQARSIMSLLFRHDCEKGAKVFRGYTVSCPFDSALNPVLEEAFLVLKIHDRDVRKRSFDVLLKDGRVHWATAPKPMKRILFLNSSMVLFVLINGISGGSAAGRFF